MSIEKDILLNKYIPFDIPVPYNDWKIHQIKIKDFYEISMALSILEMDKNTLGNVDFISMSCLRFCIILVGSDEQYYNSFIMLLRKCLSIDDDLEIATYITDDSEGIVIGQCIGQTQDGRNIIKNETARIITAKDFDEIRRIILYQNVIDYTDEFIDPDVKRAVDEYYRLKGRGISIGIEHKTLCIQLKTGMQRKEIGNLTVRNFQQLFELVAEESDYASLRMAWANGAEFKKPLEHWAYKEKKDKYSSAFCNADAFTDMVQSVN